MFIVECLVHDGGEWDQVGPVFSTYSDAVRWAEAREWGLIPIRFVWRP